jgi:hypothetical protein
MYTQYIHSLPQSRLGTANYALITSSFCYHGRVTLDMLFTYLALGSTKQKTTLYSTLPGNEHCYVRVYVYLDTSNQQ